MIIVSQDRLRISENMEIGIYPEYEEKNIEKIVGYKLENDFMYLGSYETEERAKEVLQEIINCCKDDAYIPIVYEMPEE